MAEILSICGFPMTQILYLRKKQELETQVGSLDKISPGYQIWIRAEKTKLMTNSANRIHREKLDTFTSFKYLGAVVSDNASKP